MKPWVEGYLNHLDRLMENEPEFYSVSPPEEFPPLTLITYPANSPDEIQVSFTAGLSTYSHPKWKLARPELCIAVRTADKKWGWAIGDIAHKLKGDCPFCYGDIIRFGVEISEE